MKDRPILFSGPMVRALLEGRKTQTRRIVKLAADLAKDHDRVHFRADGGSLHVTRNPRGVKHAVPRRFRESFVLHCPFGQPGDRLWVRENLWRGDDVWTYEAGRDTVKIDPGAKDLAAAWVKKTTRDVVPSIHMPRWACRIRLEITAVRVERVQDISWMDAVAEGCNDPRTPEKHAADQPCGDPVAEFMRLWNDINGAGSWAANPWVWVVEFRRLS